MWQVIFCAAVSLAVFVIMWLVRRRQTKAQHRAARIVRSLDNLMQSETGLLSFSCSVEGYEAVCVSDTWTGWAEQCFYNTTLEGALEDAIRSRDECRGK
jgi:hypothetical protein